MTPRRMRIVFWCLVASILVMGVILFVERQRQRDKVRDIADQAPADAPYTDAEPVTLDLANDNTGAIVAVERHIALPTEANARARALLDHLVDEYALPGSAHPLPPGTMVNGIFLLPLPVVGHELDPHATPTADGRVATVPVAPGSVAAPGSPGGASSPAALQPAAPGGQLAVLDLRGTFANSHPSGVEVESLTLASILATLHTNLPQIEQVRFLVDGQPRETLAGHADLLRTYPVRDAGTTPGSAP